MDADRTYSAVARLIAASGARVCFGLLGTANFKLTQSLDALGVGFVAARHECNAITMADSYARLTGELAVASVHSGPGLTHAATGIAEAAKSKTPLLILAGDVSIGDVNTNFAMNQASFVRGLGASYERLHSARTAKADARRAIARVMRNRETVVLGLPLDIQEAPVEEVEDWVLEDFAAATLQPAPALVSSLASALAEAERPLLLAGRGALTAGAGKTLETLAERCGALLATTACANGLFAGNVWSLGICGGFSSPAGLSLIPSSDLIVAFGAGLNMWTTKDQRIFGRGARIAQIDSDAMAFARHMPVDYPIHGDVRNVALQLLENDHLRHHPQHENWKWRNSDTEKAIHDLQKAMEIFNDVGDDCVVDPRSLSIMIDRLLPRDRVLVTDGGHFMGWPPRYIHVDSAKNSCLPLSFQSVGLGLAASIGASYARPDQMVVLGVGDGGFMMSISDLETAIRLKRSICIVIYNDSSYGAEVHHFRHQGFPTELVTFPEVDLAGVARAFGAQAATVKKGEDLEALSSWIEAGASGVFVIDAKIDSSLQADWHRDAYTYERPGDSPAAPHHA